MAVLGPPFGATVNGVRALILDVAGEGTRIVGRNPRVTDDQIGVWIGEGAAKVHIRIWGYTLLHPDLQEAIEADACGLVHTYAASLAVDAVHPERSGQNANRYGQVLMERFTAGVTDLYGYTATEVAKFEMRGGEDPGLDPLTSGVGAAANFPGTRTWRLRRNMGF